MLALNVSVPPVIEEAVAGDTVTAVTPEPDGVLEPPATDTVAVADFVGSATLVAVIFPTAPVVGAVNTPAAEIVPIVAAQVTESFVVVPCAPAVNCTVALGAGVATAGDTTTAVTAGVCDEPVPCNGSIAGRCAASVMNITFPSTLPTVEAENFTEKVVLCPAGRITGVVKPLIVKPAPDITAWFTLTGAVPVLANVTGSELLEPTFALIARVSGATASVGRGSATPMHPEIHSSVEAASEVSTRTIFSLPSRPIARSPLFPKLESPQAFTPASDHPGERVPGTNAMLVSGLERPQLAYRSDLGRVPAYCQ